MDAKKFNELIGIVRKGINKNALDELFIFYFPKIVKFIFRKYHDKHFAEEIAQDFFYKLLLLHADQFINKPTGWIFAVANNLAQNELKYSKRHCASLVVATNAQVQDENTIFEQVLYGDYRKNLNNLDAQTREIILMFTSEGCTLKEIAEELNLSYDAVRKKYMRGIKKLKKM